MRIVRRAGTGVVVVVAALLRVVVGLNKDVVAVVVAVVAAAAVLVPRAEFGAEPAANQPASPYVADVNANADANASAARMTKTTSGYGGPDGCCDCGAGTRRRRGASVRHV